MEMNKNDVILWIYDSDPFRILYRKGALFVHSEMTEAHKTYNLCALFYQNQNGLNATAICTKQSEKCNMPEEVIYKI